MLITKNWSQPKPIVYGQNIMVKASHPDFAYKIYNAKGKSIEGVIFERVQIINADDAIMRLIRLPMIST